ncbi:MAG: non-canonical purine NTP pyrophosphatase, partial [Pseudomonadota bacterium]
MKSNSQLIIASHNEGKVREIRDLLAPLDLIVLSAASLNLPEPEETGSSFVENAMLKSKQAALFSGNYALADDSGLCIPALNDAPGIYSARWAGESKDFAVAMQRISAELDNKKPRIDGQEAYFICVLSFTAPSGETQTFEGRVYGTLTFPPRGSNGFGYDPIFTPQGKNQT